MDHITIFRPLNPTFIIFIEILRFSHHFNGPNHHLFKSEIH